MVALNFPNSPTNGDTYEGYTYNATKGVWEINVITPGLAGLVDVDITSPAEGDALVYDGTNWVNGVGSSVANTDGDPGTTIYVGSVDPDTLYTLQAGDVWIEVP